MIDSLAPGLGFLQSALVFVLSLGLMIFFHELGHFLVAKWCDVHVHTFSIGMGRKIWRWKPGETEYTLSAIPFGGYVKMAGESFEERDPEAERDPRSFAAKGLRARSAIVLAGPAMNLVLALVVHFTLSVWIGVEAPRPVGIFAVSPGSVAEEVGLQVGDRILRMNGHDVGFPRDVVAAVLGTSAGEPVRMTLMRGGREFELDIVPRYDETSGRPLIGIGTEGLQEPIVGAVKDRGVARQAGLRPGDRLLRISGEAVSQWRDVQEKLDAAIGTEVEIVARRDGREIAVRLTPEPHHLVEEGPNGERYADIGMIFREPMQRVGILAACRYAVAETNLDVVYMLNSLAQIAARKVGRESVAGPVGIASVLAESYAYGLDHLLRLIALISVNLAVVNLLPFPVLDGGQLVFIGIEAVARRPVSERVMMTANQVGLVVLLLLFVFLTLNDLDRVLPFSIFGG
jgi:regulator of sigma E protease